MSTYLGKIFKEISGEDAHNLASIIKVETDLEEFALAAAAVANETIKPESIEHNDDNDNDNDKDFIINIRNFIQLSYIFLY